MNGLKLESEVVTHPGQRRLNEDAFGVNLPLGLFMVADGVAAGGVGKAAADCAIATLEASVAHLPHAHPGAVLAVGVMAAHQMLLDVHARTHADMRSTLVAMLMRGGRAAVAWVGDSRLYRVRPRASRGHQVECLTKDHRIPGSGQLFRMLGSEHPLSWANGNAGMPDIATFEPGPRDIYLLCSDGIHDCLRETELAAALLEGPRELAATRLCEAGLRAGAVDNLTALVVWSSHA